MNKADTYRLVTIDNGQADTASILKIFSAMGGGRLASDVSLLNYYKGVPVNYGTSIRSVDRDSLELSVHETQAAVIKLSNSTLLTCRHFPNGLGVHCYAAYVSVPKKTVILHNFAYAQIRAARREAVRVVPDKSIPAMFSCAGTGVNGTIRDISGNGISIFAAESRDMEAGEITGLSFPLMDTLLTVEGSFVRSVQSESGGRMYLFKISPDRKSDTVIGQFIYQRQIEIIRDLKNDMVVNG